jgi:hypothetical protein
MFSVTCYVTGNNSVFGGVCPACARRASTGTHLRCRYHCAIRTGFARDAPWRAEDDYLFMLSELEVGGPDLSQMESTDQLDAPNRRLPESRVRRLLNGNPPSDIFDFPRKSFTSCHVSDRTIWLVLALEALFGASQGQSW